MSKVEVLISAMHLNDDSILEQTNIKTNGVLVNQCNVEAYKEIIFKGSKVKILSTLERGLSKSRNKAIELSENEVCLLCDDDIQLYSEYENLILKAYREIPDADIIAFKLLYPGKTYGNKIKRINFFNATKVSSVEITFKRKKVLSSQIKFNEFFGSGSTYSLGEENLFLFQCLQKKLKIYYVPVEIGKLLEGKDSQWFKGFNEKYFFDKGAWLACCFPYLKYFLVFYVVLRFRKESEIPLLHVAKCLWSGISSFKTKVSFKERLLKVSK